MYHALDTWVDIAFLCTAKIWLHNNQLFSNATLKAPYNEILILIISIKILNWLLAINSEIKIWMGIFILFSFFLQLLKNLIG